MSAGVRLFGKLPVHGDFVARGLSADEREALDAWLSASLALAQAELGDAFAGRFDVAQPWRFYDDRWAGALAASTDTTGRRFPLLLAIETEPDAASATAAACEALLYDAIVEGWSADALVEQATAISLAADVPPPIGWWRDGEAAAALPEAQRATLLLAMLTLPEQTA